MSYGHAARLFCVLLFGSFATLHAADTPGAALFRSNCSFCHGAKAEGGRGPNLRGRLSHGDSPEALEKLIRAGVPGTSMPGFDFDADEMKALMAHLQMLRAGNASNAAVPGDAVAGRAVYKKQNCAGCHLINGEGSVLGPELSRVGGARSYEYLRESIVKPSADVSDGYRTVRVTLADGKKLTGILVNEDTFTLQLRLFDQRYQSFVKSTLRGVEYPSDSLMPPYALPEADLINLLAYLNTLRGDSADSTGDATKAQGVH